MNVSAAANSASADAFVRVDGVSRVFAPRLSLGDRIAGALGGTVDRRAVRAVDGVSLDLARGEVLGLVGESGCGKSTLGRMISGILPPSAGTVRVAGEPVMTAGHRPRKRTTRVQMVFQDPYASLDPRMRIGDTIAEGPLAHGIVKRAAVGEFVAAELARVGLEADAARRFPHQFSGGQRQRVAIARALAMRPDVLVCDEPVASLDVSIQAQVLNLLMRLRRELSLTMLFISHHLGVVRHLSDRVAVMYLGRVVEVGPAAAVYDDPRHPYTRALLASLPKLILEDGVAVTFQAIEGELPSPLSPPPGCHFHQRCNIAQPQCAQIVPAMRSVGAGRIAACHLCGDETAKIRRGAA